MGDWHGSERRQEAQAAHVGGLCLGGGEGREPQGDKERLGGWAQSMGPSSFITTPI